jgi:hypothetical protein
MELRLIYLHSPRRYQILIITLSESKVATHCKLDVYNFSGFERLMVDSGNCSLVVRHFGSQRIVDPSVLGRFVPVAARANRLSSPLDSPQR